MLGLAQKQFIEKSGKNPWKEPSKKPFFWPSLEKLLAAQQLGYIDIVLAQHLLQKCGEDNEAFAALICYLSAAAQLGHLCVRIEGNRLTPTLEEVWISSNENTPADPSFFESLEQLIIKNIERLPSSLLSDMQEGATSPSTPICKWHGHYYLQRYWMLETKFLSQFKTALSEQTPHLAVDKAQIHSAVEALFKAGKLVSEQGAAIKQACEQTFTVITGGPGTGKTYTAGLFLRLLWEHLNPAQQAACRIVLAAPTGKAAANLEASIQRAVNGIEGFPSMAAKTLHSLLQKRTLLNADVFLIDESSMIDVRLMGDLFAAVKPGARVLLLGDCNQLPPVEAGSLFADMVGFLQSTSTCSKHVISLKTCLRTESRSIIDIAEKVKHNDMAGVLQLLQQRNDKSLCYTSLKSNPRPKEWQQQLLNHALPHFSSISMQKGASPSSILREFLRFRILTPMRHGPLGSEELNQLFFLAIKSRCSSDDPIVVPIMIAQNHPRQDLYNGEVGILIKYPEGKQKSFAIFAARGNLEGIRQIPAILLPKYEYAYSISIHKSQGSEFDHVLMILPEKMESFGREALYTGITRARHCLEIWSSENVLGNMMERTSHRCSGVVDRLKIHH